MPTTPPEGPPPSHEPPYCHRHRITSGIGLDIARALAAETGAEVAFHGADMSRPDQIADLVATTCDSFGTVDIVVPNAGIQTVAPVEEFDPARFDLIIAINMAAAWHLARLTFGEMKARGWGRFVAVASDHGLVASPCKSP